MAGSSRVFYRDRPEWADVTPIPQSDGPHTACAIAYSEDFIDCMDFFRAILAKNEMSERAYHLTTDVISFNPANYTAWHYRRLLLKALEKDLKQELEYCNQIAEDNLKNYQVWYHRQALVEMLGDAAGELDFVEEMLVEDSKNYHAWSYRQWVNKRFNLWEAELLFVDRLLKEDLRNNSAWNHRHFVISNTTGYTPDVKSRELENTLAYCRRAPNNESAWTFLKGAVLGNSNFTEAPAVKELCLKLKDSGVRSPYMLAMLGEVYEEEALTGSPESLKNAGETYELLANEADQIRTKYWAYRKERLQTRMEQSKDLS